MARLGRKEAQAKEMTWMAAVEVGECRGEAAWGPGLITEDCRVRQGEAGLTPAQERPRAASHLVEMARVLHSHMWGLSEQSACGSSLNSTALPASQMGKLRPEDTDTLPATQ